MIDKDPTSLSAGGWLEDTSLVEKYTISEDAYNKREGLFKIVHDIYMLKAICMYLDLKFLPLQSVNSLLYFFNSLIMLNTVGHTIGLISTLETLRIIPWVHTICQPTVWASQVHVVGYNINIGLRIVCIWKTST